MLKQTIALVAIIISIVFGGFISYGPQAYAAHDYYELDNFYEPLTPYGEWVSMEPYGSVWYPTQVGPQWKPYTYGKWAWSDSGWLWVSYEPWGWATYHYGRWIMDSYYGWVWIPGNVWGPAWVEWYDSPGYVGWSPLALTPRFYIEIGLNIGHYNKYRHRHHHHHKHHHHKHRKHKKHRYYNDGYYYGSKYAKKNIVYVPKDKFAGSNVKLVSVPDKHNFTVLRNSRRHHNKNHHYYKHGPKKRAVEGFSKHRVDKVRVVDSKPRRVRGKYRANYIKGDNYYLYKPKVKRFDRSRDYKPYDGNRKEKRQRDVERHHTKFENPRRIEKHGRYKDTQRTKTGFDRSSMPREYKRYKPERRDYKPHGYKQHKPRKQSDHRIRNERVRNESYQKDREHKYRSDRKKYDKAAEYRSEKRDYKTKYKKRDYDGERYNKYYDKPSYKYSKSDRYQVKNGNSFNPDNHKRKRRKHRRSKH